MYRVNQGRADAQFSLQTLFDPKRTINLAKEKSWRILSASNGKYDFMTRFLTRLWPKMILLTLRRCQFKDIEGNIIMLVPESNVKNLLPTSKTCDQHRCAAAM